MWCSTALLAGALAASPWADQVVFGVMDASAEASTSALLAAAAEWIHANTTLTLVAGDQVGFDRRALTTCPPQALYSCLARTLLAVPSRPRAGILVARARADEVQLLVFDSAELEALVGSEDRAYAAVRRFTGPTAASALDGLRGLSGFEQPAWARVEAHGCAGCVVRVGPLDAAITGDPSTVDGLRVRAGATVVEVSRQGGVLASITAELAPDRSALVRIDVPAATPAWRPIAATGLGVAGAALAGVGLAIAIGRDDLVCATRGRACEADESTDPRAADYLSSGETARALVIGGVVALIGGAAWAAFEWTREDTPQLTVQ